MTGHDVSYFKDLIAKDKDQLVQKCKSWETELSDTSVPEDSLGDIRTAIGLTELLLGQKIKQFEGLILDCELKRGEKEVTCDDLQGFYDMIYFQIEKIHQNYSELETLKKNNWEAKVETPVIKPKVKKVLAPVVKDRKPNPSMKAHISAARQRLAEAKANALKNKEPQKENFTLLEELPESNNSAKKSEKSSNAAKTDVTIESTKEGAGKSGKEKTTKASIKTVSDSKNTKKPKEVLPPLTVVTRSAARKRALQEQNK